MLGRRRGGGVRSASVRLDAHPSSPRRARRFVGERLRGWDCEGVVDDVELVVSELVTNAVVHAGTGCLVSLRLRPQELRIEVADTGGGLPEPRDLDVSSPTGRGLQLVSAIAETWGVDADGSEGDGARAGRGKVVWAEVPV